MPDNNNSKINQLNSRPPTIIMSVRADARYMATLVNFWNSQGELPRSISELCRLSLESFAEFLVLTNKTTFVQTHSDAMQILDRTGFKMSKTNPRNMAAALLAEDSDTLGTVLNVPKHDANHQERIRTTPVSKDSPDLAAAIAAMEGNMATDLKSRIKEAQDRTKEFKEALLNPVDK